MRYLKYVIEELFGDASTFIKDWWPQTLFTILFFVSTLGLTITGTSVLTAVGMDPDLVILLFMFVIAAAVILWWAVFTAMCTARDRIKKENQEILNSIRDPK